MRFTKKDIIRALFGFELCILIAIALWGRAGYMTARIAHEKNAILAQEVSQTKKHNDELRYEIALWKTDVFLVEQYAREHLQLARPGDYIYYLS